MGAPCREWVCRVLVLVLVVVAAGCTHPPIAGPVGQVVGEGVIVCPPPTERCELSGATVATGRLLLVNDRAVRGKATDSVLALPAGVVSPRLDAAFLPGLPALPAEKLEAIATTPDGKHVFASTAFDRRESAAQDSFNVLMGWPAERPRQARVLGAPPDLRRQIRAALATATEPEGPAYFKIEGLAALPDRLLLGVREVGRTYREFRFTLAILAVPWRLERGVPMLSGPVRPVWRLEPAALGTLPRAPVGLSDIAYDAARDRLWLLTSFEGDDGVDSVAGYLWTLDRTALAQGGPPVPVRGRDGKVLAFSHKPEAVALLPDGRLMVVHDDDRRATPVPDPVTGVRRPRLQTEAYYQILSVGDGR